MRALARPLSLPTLVSERSALQVMTVMVAARRCLKHLFCALLHGGHELYRARTDTKLYQQCLLCGYETPGWTIDRRDRRLHLVSSNRTRMPKAS